MWPMYVGTCQLLSGVDRARTAVQNNAQAASITGVMKKGGYSEALLESKPQCQVILGHATDDWAILYPSSSGFLPPPEKMATSVSTNRGHRKGRKSARWYLHSAAGLPVGDMPHSKGRRNCNSDCYPQLDASVADTLYWG